MRSIDESGEGSKEGIGNGRMTRGNGNERIQGGNDTGGSMEGMPGTNQDTEGNKLQDPWREKLGGSKETWIKSM